MAFTFLSCPNFLSPQTPHFLSLKPPPPRRHLLRLSLPRPTRSVTGIAAIGPDGKYYPNPADDDPPEAPEDAGHGVSRFQQIERHAARARRREEEDYKKHQSTFLAAIADVEDAPDNPGSLEDENSGGDLFSEIDKAIALKRKEFVQQGLLEPNPKKVEEEIIEGIEELEPQEVLDLEEVEELQGLTIIEEDAEDPDSQNRDGDNDIDDDMNENKDNTEASRGPDASSSSSFDLDFDSFGKSTARIIEPKFKTTLAELLDESKLVPVSVFGDLEVELTGIQNDSRLVTAGDLFVCCAGSEADVQASLAEADKRGAVAVVAASREVDIRETLGCKALVVVDDTSLSLPALAAAFYRNPSRDMAAIGIAGSSGETTAAYLVKSVYEAMGVRAGMLSSVACYVHGENRLEVPETTPEQGPDPVVVQDLMAKMVCNGAEAVVMEASSLGQFDEVDFDIAVFTNLYEEENRDSKAWVFEKMVDPDRHRKVVNIDDPNARFFLTRGSPDVPAVTYAVEDKNADVYPLKFELSLFETQVLVNTPQGILEISSGLLGRHNVYNILAAVSVGIAVGAPLEDIVRGIEEVDAVPGRCELIDEEQAFGVVVDHAKTPDGLSRLLDSVRELGAKRVITVIGCCGEKERGKRPVMTKISTDKSDVTLLTSDNPRNEDPLDILDDMLCGVGWSMQEYLKHGENDYYPPLPNGHRIFVHDIRRVAVRCAVAMGEEGDVVVVAGKGHETYQIEGDKKEFFDDREECREALQYVDELHQAGIDTSEFPWRLPESH